VLLAQVGIDRKLAPCGDSDIGRSFSDLSCAARRRQFGPGIASKRSISQVGWNAIGGER
jgi:hypothetical protein